MANEISEADYARAEEAALGIEPEKPAEPAAEETEEDAQVEAEGAEETQAESEGEAAPADEEAKAEEPPGKGEKPKKVKKTLTKEERERKAHHEMIERRRRQLDDGERALRERAAAIEQERAEIQSYLQLARDNPVTLVGKLAKASGMTEVELLNNLQHRYANQGQPAPEERESVFTRRLDRIENLLQTTLVKDRVQQQEQAMWQQESKTIDECVAESPQNWPQLARFREKDPEGWQETLDVALHHARSKGGMQVGVLLDKLDEVETAAYNRYVRLHESERGSGSPSRKGQTSVGGTPKAPARNGNGQRPVVETDRALSNQALRELSEEERYALIDDDIRDMLGMPRLK